MADISYFSGFGGHFESEAVSGALPRVQNSPKKSPNGLYPEQLSGSAFTMKRSENKRSWLYRIQPSVVQGEFSSYSQEKWLGVASSHQALDPSPMRWGPLLPPEETVDFLDSVTTMVHSANGQGCSVHHFCFNDSMGNRFFTNADGELLFIPETGGLEIVTEMGTLHVEPQEVAVVPRGIKFQVNGLGKSPWFRGYLTENRGQPLRLPDLGPLGANGLAQPRDFLTPKAQYENRLGEFTMIHKLNGHFWQAPLHYHPMNVVAWHGNYAPYKYDLRKFNTMGTVSFDHPDPSIYTVLTSPSEVEGRANCDFVIFPPRWLVAEQTFRPPYYHRNIMNEYMGLIHGEYDAKEGGGFVPGGASLHNGMTPHGPDQQTFEKAVASSEALHKVYDTMAFMVESCDLFFPSDFALNGPLRERSYPQCWQGLKNRFEV